MSTLLNQLITLSSGLLTPLIAIMTVYIAFQQYKINRYKFIFDLFEKRYYVFKETSIVLRTLSAEFDYENLNEFNQNTKERIFYFETDIEEFIGLIIENALQYNLLEKRKDLLLVHPGNEIELGEIGTKQKMLSSWFESERKNLPIRFKNYLNLGSFKN